jgi:hypothetical protein
MQMALGPLCRFNLISSSKVDIIQLHKVEASGRKLQHVPRR